MSNLKNDADGVGQSQTYKDVTEKYDAEHGTYESPIKRDGTAPGLPNALPAGADPKPFKLGPT